MNEKVKKIQDFLNSTAAALVFSQPNRFYLTDFLCDSGLVFITKNDAVFFTDFRYLEKAKEVSAVRVSDSKNWSEQVNALIEKYGIREMLIETDYVSVAKFDLLKQKLNAEILIVDELSKQLRILRSQKSDKELSFIKSAQEMTDNTFSYILPRIEVGRTERDIMLDMEFYLRKLGSEGISFDFIVVSGKNTSLPHGVPSNKKIEKGDFITMDFGAVKNGYRSDMTRTVAVGDVTNEQRTVYDTVLKAQTAALKAIKTGVVCRDIDKIARDIIENDYAGCFGHGLGHSVGIEIHESPCLNTRDDTILLNNMVLTVEPGIYLEGRFGVRIEDMVIVNQNGCENITKSDKNLIIL